jgi:hypothetical protein
MDEILCKEALTKQARFIILIGQLNFVGQNLEYLDLYGDYLL